MFFDLSTIDYTQHLDLSVLTRVIACHSAIKNSVVFQAATTLQRWMELLRACISNAIKSTKLILKLPSYLLSRESTWYGRVSTRNHPINGSIIKPSTTHRNVWQAPE